jgi:hypothetical protein
MPRSIRQARVRTPDQAWPEKKKTRRGLAADLKREGADRAWGAGYFCHVRFLWRLAFKRFRRLCLFIFRRRFFFRLPMLIDFREPAPCAPAAVL